MTTTNSSISALQTLKGSVTFKNLSELNGRHTVTVEVDGISYYGYGFSQELAQSDAATNALLNLTNKEKKIQYKNAFYTLKEKRKGLIFQSIKKSKGIFDVSVQVDFVKYFGKGETQTMGNNDCAANVLAAFDSGDHLKNTQALYKNALSKLSEMYDNLLFQTLNCSDDAYEVYVNVDGIDYFGDGRSAQQANNDAAWEVLKSIWSGEHKKQLQDTEEYWYDDDDYSSYCSSTHSSDLSAFHCKYYNVPICVCCHIPQSCSDAQCSNVELTKPLESRTVADRSNVECSKPRLETENQKVSRSKQFPLAHRRNDDVPIGLTL